MTGAFFGRAVAGATFFTLLGAPALAAPSATMAHDLLQVGVPQCIQRAAASLQAAGMRPFTADSNTVWGSVPKQNDTVIIVCESYPPATAGAPARSTFRLIIATVGLPNTTLRDKFVQSMLTGGRRPASSGEGGSSSSGGSVSSNGGGISGAWKFTSTCNFGSGSWQGTMMLTQAAGSALTGTVTDNFAAGGTRILADSSAFKDAPPMQSRMNGNTMSLVLYPQGWSSVLQLFGQQSSARISGSIHHSGDHDCAFTMVRSP